MTTFDANTLRHAILSEEDKRMLVAASQRMTQQKIIDVAAATGLHVDVLRLLVSRGVVAGYMPNWSDPGLCDLEQAQEIARIIGQARQPVLGTGITASDAAKNMDSLGRLYIVGTTRDGCM
ncbi:MAG: hypothetical protein HC914_11065 [Chloroflexaceae bacterium]|nr:hypothetical protein [Chloroflexaceae bacterium]